MTDILNGKYFIHFDRDDGEVRVLAKLIAPVLSNGVYYATLLDASTGELIEVTNGLIDIEDGTGYSERGHFIFDNVEDLKKLLVKLKVIAESETKKHLFMLSDMLKETPAIEGN